MTTSKEFTHWSVETDGHGKSRFVVARPALHAEGWQLALGRNMKPMRFASHRAAQVVANELNEGQRALVPYARGA